MTTGTDDDLDTWLDDASREDADWEDYAEPTDTAQADRLLGVLRFLDRQAADIDYTARRRIAEVQAWQTERLDTLDNRRRDIGRLLEGWARAQHRASGGRTKTWKLPNGTLTIRPAQPRLEVTGDNEDIVARGVAALFGDQAINVRRTVVKNDVKTRVVAGPVVDRDNVPPGYRAHMVMVKDEDPRSAIGHTGEMVPGLMLLVPIEDTFKATPTPEQPA